MAAIPEQVPVAIVGGGPVGLVCSILFSLHGIDNVVFERHPSTSIHPKAVGLNQRTTEIFAKCGLYDAVHAASVPTNRSIRTAWYTSLGPDGRKIVSRDAWGGGPYAEAYEKASPCRYLMCPQIHLEPILVARARKLKSNSIYNKHEVTAVSETTSSAILTFLDRTTTTSHTISATYALACDVGRSIATSLGISWNGESDIADMVAAHFHAPLNQLQPDPRNFITWFINPSSAGVSKPAISTISAPTLTAPMLEIGAQTLQQKNGTSHVPSFPTNRSISPKPTCSTACTLSSESPT